MEERKLDDFLGKILKGEEHTEENEHVREYLKSLSNDLGNSTSEYIEKENPKVVMERISKSNLDITEQDDSIKVFNVERIINDSKRNELLAKYITKDDPYELGLDLAEKLYLNIPDRILFNDLILKDVNNLLKSIEEHGSETIEVLDIKNIYLEYLLNKEESDDLSELDKRVLDAYRKIYSYTNTTNLDRDYRPFLEVYKEIDEVFDNSANINEYGEELVKMSKECMKIQHKIRTRLYKANSSASIINLDLLKEIPLVDKCYINVLFAIELKLTKEYYDTLDDVAKISYLAAFREAGETDEK